MNYFRRSLKRWFLCCLRLCLIALALSPQTFAENNGAVQEKNNSHQTEVGVYLDRFLDRVSIAADAAEIVKSADVHRRHAESLLKEGMRDEAISELRQAGEIIAAAGNREDQDPFLQKYLNEITETVLALDAPALKPDAISQSDQAQIDVAVNSYDRRAINGIRVVVDRLQNYRSMMTLIFREEGIPEWLLAVGLIESGFDTSALSHKGALGIWQFIPETAARYGLKGTKFNDERRNPEKSTRAAAR